MQHTSIKEVPSWIEKLSRLSCLNLASNVFLTSVSMGIFKLNSLLELDISFCENLSIFPQLGENSSSFTTCLRQLSIRGCKKLKGCSQVFPKLCGLESFYLGDCEMANLEVPTSVRRLMIGGDASEVPRWVYDLPRLESFIFSSSRVLNNFPNGIFKLTSLNTLRLVGCDEEQLVEGYPLEFPSVSYAYKRDPAFDYNIRGQGITYLSIQGTRMETVPEEIKELFSLYYLDLSNNKSLKCIPDWIFEMSSLQELYLYDCQKLESLPLRIPDRSCLKVLDIRRTAIKSLPTGLTSLVWLYASNTILEQAPSLVMKDLEILELSRDKYEVYGSRFQFPDLRFSKALFRLHLCNLNITLVPDNIGDLVGLVVLDLSGNDFEVIPGSVQRLSKLVTLKLNHCLKLKSLPKLPSSVDDLQLRGCKSLKQAGFLAKSRSENKLSVDLSVSHMHSLSSPQSHTGKTLTLSGHLVADYHKCRASSLMISTNPLRYQIFSKSMNPIPCFTITVEGSHKLGRCLSFDVKRSDIACDNQMGPFVKFDRESTNMFLFSLDLYFRNPRMLDAVRYDTRNPDGVMKAQDCGLSLTFKDIEEDCNNDASKSDEGETSGRMACNGVDWRILVEEKQECMIEDVVAETHNNSLWLQKSIVNTARDRKRSHEAHWREDEKARATIHTCRREADERELCEQRQQKRDRRSFERGFGGAREDGEKNERSVYGNEECLLVGRKRERHN